MSNRKTERLAVLLLLAGSASAFAYAGTDPVDDPKFQSGYLPAATYAGPHVRVNLQNGAANLTLPLFTLPGRAGLDLDVVLSYSSKQLAAEDTGSRWVARWLHEGPTVGRWVVNLWPSLQEEVPGSLYYFTTPSGAVHKLSRLDSGSLYTSDSTNIRFNSITKKVEFFDGLTYDFSQYDSQGLVHERDRNGNQITYSFETVNGFERPDQVTDTLGRVVQLLYDDEVGGTNRTLLREIRVKNHAGTDLVYTFDFVQRYLVPHVYTGTYPSYRYYGVDAAQVSGWQWVLSSLTLPNGLGYQMQYADDVVPGRPWPDETVALSRLTLPTGAVLDLQYGGPSSSHVLAGHWRLSKMVTSITTDPVGGGAFTTSYGYAWDTANWYPTRTTETRADGSKHVVDWNPEGGAFEHLRQKESWTDSDGRTPLREVETYWVNVTSGNEVNTAIIRDPATGWESKTVRLTDSWGREASRTIYDQYEIVPGVFQFRATAGVRRHWNDIGSNYFNLLLQEDTVDYYGSDERVVASTRYQYDQFALTDRGAVVGQAAGYGPSFTARGNLTTLQRELFSESRFLETTSTYDTVGNMVQTTDPEGHSASIAYSPVYHFAYPTSATNALGHTSWTDYDVETGLVVSATDPNGHTVSYLFDAYNRVTREDYPDGGWTQYFYKDDYFSGKYRTYVRTRTRVVGNLYRQQLNFYDGLGRLLRSQFDPPAGEAVIRVDREYSVCSCAGRTSRVSMPYRAGEAPKWTESRFDGIGRVTKVIPPDGTASSNHTEYKYGTTQIGSHRYRVAAIFDARGVGEASVYDASGRLLQVREDVDYTTLASSTVTDYDQRPDASYSWQSRVRYNPGLDSYQSTSVRVSAHNWSEIFQGVQVRSFKRDSLGRTAEETHPETGTTTYGFSDDGLVQSRTDARGIVTSRSHDSLHRLLTIDYSDATPPASYVYDQGANGVGRLYQSSNANAESTYGYDAMGRKIQQEEIIGGLSFSMSWSYNYASQPASIVLPNGTTVSYSHDKLGRLVQVASDWVDANHPAVLADNFQYHPTGAPVSVDWGNGTTTERTFNDRLQLKTLTHGTQSNPAAYVDLEYDYQEGVANTGQIMSIIDHRDPSRTIDYTYDDFHRLKTAATQGTHWGLSWSYDRYGNRLSQTKTKGTAPTSSFWISASNNRVNGWSHDAAGNVLNDGQHTYAYDANNMVTAADGGASTYRYDSGANRVMKQSAGETLYYVMEAGIYSSQTGWTLFLEAAGNRIEYSGGTTRFYQSDHLGTAIVQTSVSGAVEATHAAYPFGETWQQTGTSTDPHGYTGHLEDSETGLEYAGARYYSSSAGRWTTADPYLVSPGVPQSLNRYAYVAGDPVRYDDPNGLTHETVTVTEQRCVSRRRVPNEPPAPGNPIITHCFTSSFTLPGPGHPRPNPREELGSSLGEIRSAFQEARAALMALVSDTLTFLEENENCDKAIGFPGVPASSILMEKQALRKIVFMDLPKDASYNRNTGNIEIDPEGNVLHPTRATLDHVNAEYGWNLTLPQLPISILLHELGHAAGRLAPFDDPDSGPEGKKNFDANNRYVLENCFPK